MIPIVRTKRQQNPRSSLYQNARKKDGALLTNVMPHVESFVKIAVAVFAIYQGMIAVDQYQQVKRKEIEVIQYAEKLSIYSELTRITGSLTKERNRSDWQKLRDEYWAVLYGQATLVTNFKVRRALLAFGEPLKELTILEQNLAPEIEFMPNIPSNKKTYDALRDRAKKVGQEARNDLRTQNLF